MSDMEAFIETRHHCEPQTGDYDFMLRVMTDPEIKLHYIPEVIISMRMGGASTGSLKGIINKSREDYLALRRNAIACPLAVLMAKNLSKLNQLNF